MALISICDDAGNVIQTHEHTGRFQRAVTISCVTIALSPKTLRANSMSCEYD